jgi:hypothetical protein
VMYMINTLFQAVFVVVSDWCPGVITDSTCFFRLIIIISLLEYKNFQKFVA